MAAASKRIKLIRERTLDTSRRIKREGIIYFGTGMIVGATIFSRIAAFAFDTSGPI